MPRRELLGGLLATLIVGRDSGFQPSAPPCRKCQQPMTFEAYRSWTVKGLDGDSVLEGAYYVCPACAGETFSLSGSETGFAGVSFGVAGRRAWRRAWVAGQVVRFGGGFSDAVGRSISGDSLARLTEDWGQRVEEQRNQEAADANQPGQRGERLAQRRLVEVAPITPQANISTDVAMMLVREEGWKEVKVVAISEVQTQPASARASTQPSRRDVDLLVELQAHSYQAGLWDADTMALHQYAEGLRRGLDYCPKRSSVNDGTLWIKRITDRNFPKVP